MKYFKILIAVACLAFSSLGMATYFDNESGLYENGFREYRPPDGRYSQPDPIGLNGGWNRIGFGNQNPLMYMDPTGLATTAEITAAVATLRSSYPAFFSKMPASVISFPMGENGLGSTDWRNNIQLNSDRFGTSSECVKSGDEYQFLQTLAHEMLHVNESVPTRLLSNSFRMGNPLGYLHRKLDDEADAMVTAPVIQNYVHARNSDKTCSCR